MTTTAESQNPPAVQRRAPASRGLWTMVAALVLLAAAGGLFASTSMSKGSVQGMLPFASVLDDASLNRLREELWARTGLVRVYLRDGGDPVALEPPATVLNVADTIHHELRERCTGARVWGPSARFEGQRVGPHHELADGDAVEILTR